jgi:SH3-like domain-containing protein
MSYEQLARLMFEKAAEIELRVNPRALFAVEWEKADRGLWVELAELVGERIAALEEERDTLAVEVQRLGDAHQAALGAATTDMECERLKKALLSSEQAVVDAVRVQHGLEQTNAELRKERPGPAFVWAELDADGATLAYDGRQWVGQAEGQTWVTAERHAEVASLAEQQTKAAGEADAKMRAAQVRAESYRALAGACIDLLDDVRCEEGLSHGFLARFQLAELAFGALGAAPA